MGNHYTEHCRLIRDQAIVLLQKGKTLAEVCEATGLGQTSVEKLRARYAPTKQHQCYGVETMFQILSDLMNTEDKEKDIAIRHGVSRSTVDLIQCEAKARKIVKPRKRGRKKEEN